MTLGLLCPQYYYYCYFSGSFDGALSKSKRIVSNGRMVGEYLIGKEESGRGIICDTIPTVA